MRIPTQLGYVVSGAAALAIVASSAAGAATTRPTYMHFGMNRAALATHSVLAPALQGKARPTAHFGITRIRQVGSCPSAPAGFISDFNNSVVYELNSSGTTCATLTGFTNPQGLAVNGTNLYVANTDASTIVEIDTNSGNTINTYNDPGQFPTDVAVANNSGNFVAASIESTSGGAGGLQLFTAGNTSGPTGTASGSTYTSPRFLAYDKQQNAVLFDDYDLFNTGAINVGAILPGNYTGTKNIVPVTLSNSLTFPGGVQFNSSNQPVIDDQGAGSSTLYTYTISGTTLHLSQTTPLSSSSDAVSFALIGPYALTADAGLAAAQLYKYPAGGSPVGTFAVGSGSLPIGAATVPSTQFSTR